jgi:hypothetical protein
MRTKFLMTGILVSCLATAAFSQPQVTMVLQVPPTGVMMKSQLWNLALVYAGSGTISVTVQLTLFGAKDNQPMMTAQTRLLVLNKGANVITANVVSPVQYNYLSSVFSVDRDPNGFLPVGNYKACYSVIGRLHNIGPLAEDCIPVEVRPLSPPQLNTPADTSTVQTAYPQFTWLPPAPANLFSNLTYEMLIVKVLPGQGPYEAIQQNVPMYNIGNYREAVEQYPASNAPLDTATTYAWRVICFNEGQFIDQSEVWTFKLASKNPPAVLAPPDGNYIPLRKSNEAPAGVHTLTGTVIGIKYYSYEKDHSGTVSFFDAEGKLVTSEPATITYGDNFLAYPLGSVFQKGKLYRVEIIDGGHLSHEASFMMSAPSQKK